MPNRSQPGLRILIIDDEQEIVTLLKSVLEREGYEVAGICDSRIAIECIDQYQPHILILDKIMPHISGDEIIAQLRAKEQFTNLPVIVLSGNINTDSKIESLKNGADDYLVKPFSMPELFARLQVVNRKNRITNQVKSPAIRKIGDLSFNFSTATITLEGKEVALTPTESKLLNCLLDNMDQVQSRDTLKTQALNSHNVTARTIDVHVVTLRKKLGNIGRSIRTVRGIGYRFVPPTGMKV